MRAHLYCHGLLHIVDCLCETGPQTPDDILQFWLLYKKARTQHCPSIVQELSESRGGRPGLSVLTSLLVSVDVKNY